MHVVTIAARNYLPMARVLARSFRASNPTDGFSVLVVDADDTEPIDASDFDVIRPSQLSLERAEFFRMAMIYDVTELSTALKPWALEYLIENGANVAVYLDPDIKVYSSLADIEKRALRHGLVLTPHTTVPMKRDGLRPSEADIMGSGIYNLGFIAVSAKSREMLEWWQARLSRDSISAPESMLFTDQRWIDMVPGYYPHWIERDPGYNVAYWNLDARPLHREGENVLVGSSPLRFFHFSGYRPDKPWILSKYVADNPRVVLSEHEVVRELCDEYGLELLALGFGTIDTPYRYANLPDGTAVTPGLRRMLRKEIVKADNGEGTYPPAPLADPEGRELVDWLREPVLPGSPVNRVLQAVWDERPDLQRAFPDPNGADSAAFITWAAARAVIEGAIAPELLPVPHIDEPTIYSASDERGVNLFGYFSAELGMGQYGRLLVEAARLAEIPNSTHRSVRTVSRQGAEFTSSDSSTLYPINIAVINADQFALWTNDVGEDVVKDRYVVGVWAWELDEFPEQYSSAFDLVDEVWAISAFTRIGIQAMTDKPVHVLPYPVPAVTAVKPLEHGSIGIPDEPYLCFCFDYLSVFERKNPLALVEAFTRAFDEGAGPNLVIKSINGERCRTERDRLRLACRSRSDIYLIEDYLTGDTMKSLIGSCLAYVSLHRSEGLGLTMIEAMSHGRPVIATGYSGNLDFMTPDNSVLVPYTLAHVGPDAGPYKSTAMWAEPDVDAAAQAMRRVFQDPQWAADLGRRAKAGIAQDTALERAARFVDARVDAIMGEVARRKAQATPIEVALTADEVAARARSLIDTPADMESPTRFKTVAPAVRRAVHRLLAHYDHHVTARLSAILEAQEAARAEIAVQFAVEAEQRSKQLAALESRIGDREDLLLGGIESAGAQLAEVHELQNKVDDSAGRIADVGRRLDMHSARNDLNSKRIDEIVGRFETVISRVDLHDTELAARPFMTDPAAIECVDSDGVTSMGYEGAERAGYAGFEDVFRGSEEFVASRLKPYVDLVSGNEPVVDLGCGRGEFLQLLADEGVTASGIELDPSMLERCRARGLEVVEGDAVSTLAARDAESVGSVTSFQVIEHLDPDTVRELFNASFRVLKPGGVMIAETVNPHSPAALKTFWLDITHVRPLYPEALLFAAKECGFASARIVFPQGSSDLEWNLRNCGEYAIVATRGE